jgi:hypothetical protein
MPHFIAKASPAHLQEVEMHVGVGMAVPQHGGGLSENCGFPVMFKKTAKTTTSIDVEIWWKTSRVWGVFPYV